jgi:hypothetical protein
MLIIIVGHEVALRAATSVFFMLPPKDLSCGVNRSTNCARASPLLLPHTVYTIFCGLENAEN